MTDLSVGVAAMRADTEQDALDRIAAGADEAARDALAHFGEDEWLGIEFAEALLMAARTLRQAGRRPSSAVVEAMERCVVAHQAWADVWGQAEAAEMAQALARPPAPPAEDADPESSRTKVGFGELMKGVMQARRS